MRTPLPINRSRGRGAALVIVLAFVVLVCGVVVAFFCRAASNRELSNSSFHQVKVAELARSALDLITGNLKQEIAAGSTACQEGDVTIYLPRNAAAALPVRNGVGGSYPSPTLLRVSSATAISSPGMDCAASAVDSTGTSANGRAVTRARWNQHYLVPRDPAKFGGSSANKLGTDPVPAFPAPQWVFVTGSGPAVPALTAPNASVVGRYAYAMYDEGALLDANVAGGPYAPANTSGTVAAEYALKGSVAFADLTALSIPVSTGLNNLAGWRHYASLQPNGTLQSNFTFSSTVSAQYRDLILSNTSGFLRVGEAARNGQTDQLFLSRQELIAFSRATSGSILRQDALQYLGTFSRALTAPSWGPGANASTLGGDDAVAGTFAYRSNADVINITGTDGSFLFNPNRNLPNIRFASACVVTHYDDDGNASRYRVRAGASLLQRRFSLAKLAWLTSRGPSASLSSADSQYQKGGTPEAIRACFGLVWVPSADANTAPYWDYVECAQSPVAIKTLAAVAAENREPNFFEMLKAGILAGSLGTHPGAIGANASLPLPHPAGTVYEGPAGAGFERFSGERNRHVLQIGANIIDQADGDSIPTAIHFPAFAEDPSVPGDKIANMVFGNENLPYLTQLVPLGMEYPQGTLSALLQPSVWNPHQAPATAPAIVPPSQFRTRVYGRGQADWYLSDAGLPNNHFTSGTATDFDASAIPGPGTVYFNDPKAGGTASAFYTRPVALCPANIDTTQTPAQNVYPAVAPTYPGDGGSPNKYAGILVGRNTAFAAAPLIAEAGHGAHLCVVCHPSSLTVCLECFDAASATWRPYSFISRLSAPAACGGTGTLQAPPALNGSTQPGAMSYVRVDPRTDRFSVADCRTASGFCPPGSSMEASASTLGRYESYFPARACGFTYEPDPGAVASVSGQAVLPQAWAINQPSVDAAQWTASGSNAYYADPDGVVRPGDGFRRVASTGDGCMLFHGDQLPKSAAARRPVILNRAFRSVGELGYVFRDLPFKTLDFSSPLSADAGLLDIFTLRDEPAICAGQVNLSNAPAPVLQAILSGAFKTSGTSSTTEPAITKAEALALSGTLAAAFNGSAGPLLNRADLATRLSGAINQSFTSAPDKATKTLGEAPVRALAEVANTRTWNLFVDVIAQTGVFSPGAKDLQQFVVQGEQRYWLHLAIDRYTGTVVDQQLEPVYE